jgi:hypothetical protein
LFIVWRIDQARNAISHKDQSRRSATTDRRGHRRTLGGSGERSFCRKFDFDSPQAFGQIDGIAEPRTERKHGLAARSRTAGARRRSGGQRHTVDPPKKKRVKRSDRADILKRWREMVGDRT